MVFNLTGALGDNIDVGDAVPFSARYRAENSNYLNRSMAAGDSRKVMTFSFWAKLAGDNSYRVFVEGDAVNNYTWAGFGGSGSSWQFRIQHIDAGTATWGVNFADAIRDFSAWYHFVLQVDTTAATPADRLKAWKNGVPMAQAAGASFPAINSNVDFGSGGEFRVGSNNPAGLYFDGYLADVIYADGLTVAPTDFGRVSAATGIWVPKNYTGSYGTNGFRQQYGNSAAFGTDTSGNGNTFTDNGFTTADQVIDTPTDNFCTLTPNDVSTGVVRTFSEGNLRVLHTSGTGGGRATFGVNSGKWYFEGKAVDVVGSPSFGICNENWTLGGDLFTSSDVWFVRVESGALYNGGTSANMGAFAANDIVNIAYDADTGNMWIGKNNVWHNSGDPVAGTNPTFSNLSGVISPMWASGSGNDDMQFSFGQLPFVYTPPADYLMLSSKTLPEQPILIGARHYQTALDTGANIKATAEGLFAGDFLEWIKDRNNANNHQLLDTVVGLTLARQNNTTAAEGAYVAPAGNSVAWVWNAGAAPVANSDGSIASQVSANTLAGISIVTATLTGTAATLGHGQGKVPAMIVGKRRNATGNWAIYHVALGPTQVIYRNLTNAAAAGLEWNNTAPTSTVFSVGTALPAGDYVFEVYAEIPGFSAFGSYVGNGNADGPFINTGFQLAVVDLKRSSAAGNDWFRWDTLRSPYNPAAIALSPNTTGTEATTGSQIIDPVSSGFKMRDTSINKNASGSTYIYAAFAENPFKYARAR